MLTPTDTVTPKTTPIATHMATSTPTFQFSADCGDGPCRLVCQVCGEDRDDRGGFHGYRKEEGREGDHDGCQDAGVVHLSWFGARHGLFRNPEGYLVFRASAPGGPYSLIRSMTPVSRDGDGPISTTDQPGPGAWCYAVRAFKGGSLSEATEPCCENIKGTPGTATKTPIPLPTATITPTPRETRTFTPTPTCTHHHRDEDALQMVSSSGFAAGNGGNPRPVTAAPNPSRNGAPIRFQFALDQPSALTLVLYNLMGEVVYSTRLQGNSGINGLAWNLQNLSGTPVASGLYIYVVQVAGPNTQTYVGKVAVLR